MSSLKWCSLINCNWCVSLDISQSLALNDALLREQAMTVVTRNLRIFIMERKPKDIGEMSILAEQYLEVHGNTYNFANVDKHRHNLVGVKE